MRVLLVTSDFSGAGREPWLLDDLAEALAEAGHFVDVIIADAKRGRPRGEKSGGHPNIRVFSTGPVTIRSGPVWKLLGYINTGINMHTRGFTWASNQSYDLCLSTSIASFDWGFPKRVRKGLLAAHSLLFIWDFFPIHQIEIGRIRTRWLAPVMKAAERNAIDAADTVALMSPANTRFFHRYHAGATNNTIEIPPWSSSKPIRFASSDSPPLSVLFGGQITRGRGVDTLLQAAALLLETGEAVEINIAGDGSERERLEQNARRLGLKNVSFLGALPREKYRELARSAHIGVAVTVAGISPPSFPSKIVEYCSLGLPVVVCVEESSDAGSYLVDHGAGFSVPAGDAIALADALREALQLLEIGSLDSISRAALKLFDSKFSVERVVESIENLAR